MSDPSTSSPSGGVSRFVGVGLSLIIGFVVFTVGVSLFPIEPPAPPEPAPRPASAPIAAATAPPEAAPTAPSPAGAGGAPAAPLATDGGSAAPPTVAAAPDGGGRPGETGKPAADKPSRAEMKPAVAAAAKAAAPSPRADDAATSDAESAPALTDAGIDGSASGGAGGNTSASADEAEGGTSPAPVADCTLSDKDIAREAGRHNWPTVCPVADSKGEAKGEVKKAFLIIPIKGSVENAASELKRKPVREARVTLPAAESQLSLKQYKLRRLGFKDLKIGPPDEGSGTRIRVRLMNGAGDPAFEIKDGYAKITVLTPSPSSSSSAAD
jgi:hypothetical protein